MPSLAGVPVARGAPHAAMLCQQTAPMPSICSVTYIKCLLLSLSPQLSEPCPPSRLTVQMCMCLRLASGFILRHVFWWVWMTKVPHRAMIDCVKIRVNGSVFGIICDQTFTQLCLNTNWHFLGFYSLPFYTTLYQIAHPWPAQTSSNTCKHTQ